MIVSLMIIAAGLALIWNKGLRYGVDFSGGTAIHLKFSKVVPLDSIRAALKDAGFQDSGVQGFKDPTEVLVRLPQKISAAEQIEQLSKRVSEVLTARTSVTPTILSTEYVGPQVGAELREQARLAIAWSLAGLLIYVWFRFEFLWGFSAIVCLAHDVLITLAFFSFFDREISLTVVAAFLTIVGFSLNDTIVIYDRVRDNLKTMRSQPLEQVINLSLNQMLNRTILTNGTVLVVTIVLYIFGGTVINDFAFAMLVGGVSGTYSTVYIASALIVLYEKYFGKRKKLQAVKARATQKVS
jgi:preprotein translocase subunit SecF